MVDLVYRNGLRTNAIGRTVSMAQDVALINSLRLDKGTGPRIRHLSDFELVQLDDRWAVAGYPNGIIAFMEAEALVEAVDPAFPADPALFDGEKEVPADDPALPKTEGELDLDLDPVGVDEEPINDRLVDLLISLIPARDSHPDGFDIAVTAIGEDGEAIKTEIFYNTTPETSLNGLFSRMRHDVETSRSSGARHVRTVIDIAH